MNIEEIANRIANPNLCTVKDVDALRDLTEKYPYAQSFSILYLKALASNNDIRFDEELLKHAYKITDKSRIYELIQDKASDEKVQVEQETEKDLIIPQEEEKEVITEIKPNLEVEDSPSIIEDDIISEKKETEIFSEEEIIPLEIEEKTISESNASNEPEELKEEEEEKNNSTSLIGFNIEKELEEVTKVEDTKINNLELEQEDNDSEIDIEQESINEHIESDNSIIVEEEEETIDTSIQNKEIDPLEKEVILHAVSSNYSLEETTSNSDELDTYEDEVKEETEDEVEKSELDESIIEETVDTEVLNENIDNKVSSKKIAFSSWLKANKTSIEDQQKTEPLSDNEAEELNKTEEIVNKFLINEPSISKPIKESEITEKPKKEFYSPIKIGKQSLDETTLPVSETLAKIFAAQGDFPKSIYVYNRLMLIYPEKKIFFASKIEELEQKLNK